MASDEWGGCKVNWSDELPDCFDERGLLIEAVKAGNMPLWKAEQVAAEKGFLPLAPEPDPSALNVMELRDWTAEMVMAWIIWRDPQRVAHFHKPFHQANFPIKSPFDSIAEPDLNGIKEELDQVAALKEQELGDAPSYEKVLEELLDALQSRKISADGTKLRTMDTEDIGAREWLRLTPIYGEGGATVAVNRLGLQIYGDILFNAHDVVRAWPQLESSSGASSNSAKNAGGGVTRSGGGDRGPTTKSASEAEIRRAMQEAIKFFDSHNYLMWTREEAEQELPILLRASRQMYRSIFAEPDIEKHLPLKQGRRGPVNENRSNELVEFRQFFESANMRK